MTDTNLKSQDSAAHEALAKVILKKVKTVQPLSPGAGQLLTLIGLAEYEIADVVKIIEVDPGLTANVLKTVNSAALGVRREVKTVVDAVAFLGETKVVGIALAASAGDLFNSELAGYQGNRGDLGRHCLWTAIASRELARHTNGRVELGVAFTAGLLHDIGKAVISDYLADSAADLTRLRSELVDSSQLELETEAIGTNHCEVGQALAQRWRLPDTLSAAIEHHHLPALASPEFKAIAYVVHMADMLAMMFGVGTGVDDMQYDLDPGYLEYVDLSASGLEGLALDVQVDFKATAEALFGDNQETEE